MDHSQNEKITTFYGNLVHTLVNRTIVAFDELPSLPTRVSRKDPHEKMESQDHRHHLQEPLQIHHESLLAVYNRRNISHRIQKDLKWKIIKVLHWRARTKFHQRSSTQCELA